jgi:teichoic acid transport system ATP-binding protein
VLDHGVRLPDDVLVSVEAVKRAARRPPPEVPPWLARFLPKSGLAGKGAAARDFDDADNPEDEMADFEGEEPAALSEISFVVRRGEGMGLLGKDGGAVSTLMRILVGGLPPTAGRVVFRGRVAPLLRGDLMRYVRQESGKDAVFLVARYLHWPRSLLRARWQEIEAFARLEELENLSGRRRDLKTTTRLIFSAALHLDASIYVVDHGIQDDTEFGMRCVELLEERKREGAAIVQSAQKMVDDVARLCDHILWLDEGVVAFEGRPVEVAAWVAKSVKQKVHPLALPVSAALADGAEAVEIGEQGMTIPIELHVLRSNLEFSFALELADEAGRERRIHEPRRTKVEVPGIYQLGIFIPPAHLDDGQYTARLMVEINVVGSEPDPARELLTFAITAASENAKVVDEEPSFELVPPEADEEPEREVGWSVSRTPS